MKRLCTLLAIAVGLISCCTASMSAKALKVFQINVWHEGTMVPDGFDAIVDAIERTDADIVLFSEVRNYNNVPFVPRITKALLERGKRYYGNDATDLDVGIITRYPQSEQTQIYPSGGGSGSILRVTIRVDDKNVAVYSAHLNYTNYACYLPRGYDGDTWSKIASGPVTDSDSILIANRRSWRDESIKVFLDDARSVLSREYLVILGGDFNEPSHLDWRENTSNLWDHNGATVDWDCSCLLYESGFKDAYRVVNPNVLTHPGFTFPADNNSVPVRKLAWAPDADERDRIDFIYFYPHSDLCPVRADIVGPQGSIVRNERVDESTLDSFITPGEVWPSDHKGVLVEFSMK